MKYWLFRCFHTWKTVRFLCWEILNNQELIMSALDNTNTKLDELKAAVEAFVAANANGATEAQVVALGEKADAIKAEIPA